MKILLAKYQISIYVSIKTQVVLHGIFVENFERNHKTHTHKHKHTFLVHYWLFFIISARNIFGRMENFERTAPLSLTPNG